MAKAIWKGAVLAESQTFETVEGNVYFPPESINRSYFRDSDNHTVCSWKGVASYYHIVVGEHENRDAAWYYPTPKEAAKQITNHIAFWRGVEVVR